MGELHIIESTKNEYQLLPLLELRWTETTRRIRDAALIKQINVSGIFLVEVFYWDGLFT